MIGAIKVEDKTEGDGRVMDYKVVQALLMAHIAAKNYISIQERHESEPGQCIPLSIGKTHLLGLNFRDFLPDGYRIIPLEQIVSIAHTESDAYFGDIVKREGIEPFVEDAPYMDLSSWLGIFQFTQETREFVIVELGEGGYLDAGRVMAVAADGIEMRRFDAAGIWDEKNTFIAYTDMSSVEIRSHYIKMFTKYLNTDN